MKKILSILMVFALAFALIACQPAPKQEEKKADKPADQTEQKQDEKKEEQKEADKPADAAEFKATLVTDTGGIDDKSFNQGTWEGIQRFGDETKAQINYLQSNADSDYIPNLSTAAESDSNIIVAAGFLFSEAITTVGTNYPDQHFLLIDSVVELPNVASAVFAEHEGSFLAGVAAAQAAKEAGKDTVGYIGGGDFDLIQKFEAGYEQGVKAVDPNMKVMIDYVGDFTDTGKAQSFASKMYDNGAYVIYHASGGAGNGLIKEAKDRAINGQTVWAIGVDRDQYEDGVYADGKSVMLTSMVKRVDTASHDVAQMAFEGKFPGGQVLTFTLANDGVGLPKENPNMSAEAVKMVEEFAQKIKSGEVKVDTVPERIKNKQ